jgi:hypothetical protein
MSDIKCLLDSGEAQKKNREWGECRFFRPELSTINGAGYLMLAFAAFFDKNGGTLNEWEPLEIRFAG